MMKTHSKKSSRTIKKAFAVVMSFALAMSTLTVAPDVAAAKKVAPKLSVTKKTLYYNKAGKKTYTLKVKKNKVKKITKTTWKTSKKSVVAISKKTKTSVKLTAKKAGKAKITAVVKYTVKGSKKVKSKKLTFTATSKKAKVATATPKPTATATATATAAPTATATATAEPTATATAEPTQTPIVGDVAKVDAIITNSVMGQENTILAGQDATIQVLVTDSNGNPVPNDNVVISFGLDKKTGTPKGRYFVSSQPVATTNAKGIATFVVSASKQLTDSTLLDEVKNSDGRFVGAYDFKVTDASENISATGKLKVAAISYTSPKKYKKRYWDAQDGDVVCLNGEDYEDLVTGTNSQRKAIKGKQTGDSGYASVTTNISGNKVQYVGSQQVSTTGKDHKVAFKTGVYLTIPNESKEETVATSHVQTINKQSGSYDTYASKKEVITFDVNDLSNVSYATLNFKSLKLSKNTCMDVWTVAGDGTKLNKITRYDANNATISQENFGLQINNEILMKKRPKEEWRGTPKGICLEILSEGQVDTGNNAGFDVKDLSYVCKTQGVVPTTTVPLDSASVKWETVTPVYTEEKALPAPTYGQSVNEALNDLPGAPAAGYASIKVMIPVFPYAGNAIIKCYDSNNKVKKYFACSTKNDGKNVNVLVDPQLSTENGPVANPNFDLYEISEAEATNSVGTITEKDGVVEVDSTASGTTFLKGTITCTDTNVKLDADCDTVYTSVMWNPVEENVSKPSEAFMAFVGQSITLKAQLVDANGNAVSTANKTISWNMPNETGTISPLQKDDKTDSKGQATLKLNAVDPTARSLNITATEDSKTYKVVLKIGDKTVEKADLYWIAPLLAFTDKVEGTTTKSDNATPNVEVSPSVGESWEYATKVVPKNADVYPWDAGELKNLKIVSITGVVPSLTKADGSKGTVTLGTDGIAKVTSTEIGRGVITYTLDSNTKFDKAQVSLENSNATVKRTVELVGEGQPAIDETLNLSYIYNPVGRALSFVDPTGTKTTETTKHIYVKLTDSRGNAIRGERVNLSISGDAGPALSDDFDDTDENGIATVDITGATAGDKVTVKAELASDTSITKSQSYIFKAAPTTPFQIAGENGKNGVDYEKGVVTLTLNEKVLSTSVIKELFTVTLNPASDNKQYTVKEVAVQGQKIVLTLKNANFDFSSSDKLQVEIADNAALEGINYAVTADATGQKYADTLTLTGDGHVESTYINTNAVDSFNDKVGAAVTGYTAPLSIEQVDALERDYNKLTATQKTTFDDSATNNTNYTDLVAKRDDVKKARDMTGVVLEGTGYTSADAFVSYLNGTKLTTESLDAKVTASASAQAIGNGETKKVEVTYMSKAGSTSYQVAVKQSYNVTNTNH